jgi:rubredoxin
VWRTFFMNPPAGTREPQAFLIEYGPGVLLQTHFHDVDEFQVVVQGGGTLGRHVIEPYVVHHARAWTPYGPIVSGPEGLAFLTLRARRDSAGPRKLPEQREALEAASGRVPWQASERLAVPPGGSAGTCLAPLERVVDAAGPLGELVLLAADAVHEVAPATGGAFVALLRGSLRESDGRCAGLAVAFVPSGGLPLRLVAGPDGAAALVLRFRAHDRSLPKAPDASRADTWHCSLCGSVYDPDVGDPSSGIAPGTSWDALPDDWRCPDCDAPRAAFESGGTA